MKTKYYLFSLAFVLSLGLDQLTKAWVRHALPLGEGRIITVIPGFFELQHSENSGAAFGLFRNLPGASYVLGAVAVVALVLLVGYLRRVDPKAKRFVLELGLLAGGCLGNLIDRVLPSHTVTDFVVWRIGTHQWPTFNIADAALVVGVIGLMFDWKAPEKAGSERATDGQPQAGK